MIWWCWWLMMAKAKAKPMAKAKANPVLSRTVTCCPVLSRAVTCCHVLACAGLCCHVLSRAVTCRPVLSRAVLDCCLRRRSRPATIFQSYSNRKLLLLLLIMQHSISTCMYFDECEIFKYSIWWLLYIMIIANKQIVLTLKSWHAIHSYQNSKIIHIDAIKWSIWSM